MASLTAGQLVAFLPYGLSSATLAPMRTTPLGTPVLDLGWTARFVGNLLAAGGSKNVSGKTYELTSPAVRRVVIMTQPPNAAIVYESNTLLPGATFSFPNLAPGNYMVIDSCLDNSRQALVYDWVAPCDSLPPVIAAAPTVSTNAASNIGAGGATLNGTITSNGAATTPTFEYGLTTAYGSTVAATQNVVGPTGGNVAVSAPVTGLAAGTLYHYRVVGTNSAGTTNGSDQTFTPGDTLFNSVQLLLHGDGADNGTAFTDASLLALTPTVTGSIVTATDVQGFGGSSIRCFTGAASYLTYSGRTFAAAGEAFTFEFWMRINNGLGNGAGYAEPRGEFMRLATGSTLGFSANGLIGFGTSTTFAVPNAGSLTLPGYGGITNATDRVFVMLCRDAANVSTLYFNGYYATGGTIPGAIDTIVIGNRRVSVGNETGAFVEEIRFTKGVERQLRGSLSPGQFAFTPPTAAFPHFLGA